MSASQLMFLCRLYSDPSHGITPQLLYAIIQVESHGNPMAIGDGGLARGLAQFHPRTWRNVTGLPPSRRTNARESVRALRDHLREAADQLDDRGLSISPIGLARYHNSGRPDGRSTKYTRKVLRVMKRT